MFGLYDFIIQRKQREVVEEAERAKQIVSELFPRNVKDRLLAKKDYNDNVPLEDLEAENGNGLGAISSHTRGSIMTEKSKSKALAPYETKPIADLFVSHPRRTVHSAHCWLRNEFLTIVSLPTISCFLVQPNTTVVSVDTNQNLIGTLDFRIR